MARRTEDGRHEVRPVFVVGVPRSGTTWVQRILATHPEAWPLLETYIFSREVGLGALFRRLPPPGLDVGAREIPPPGIGRIFGRDELVAEVRAVAMAWLARASDPGSTYVIDKSPWHLSDLDLIAEVIPEARLVHVVRDGRDVAVSLATARRSWSRYGGSGRVAVVREAAEVWAAGIEKVAVAKASLGGRLLEIRYEDIHKGRRAACRRLFDHCRMPHNDQLLDQALELTDFHHVPQQALYRGGRVGDWRQALGLMQAWQFERVAGVTLRETGYETDSRWWRRQPLRSFL